MAPNKGVKSTTSSDYRLITKAFEESKIAHKLPTIIPVSTIIAFIKAFIHWQHRSGFTVTIFCLTGNPSAHHHHLPISRPSALPTNSTTDGLNSHDKLYSTTDHWGGLVTHDKLATGMAVMMLTHNIFLSFSCSALPSRC